MPVAMEVDQPALAMVEDHVRLRLIDEPVPVGEGDLRIAPAAGAFIHRPVHVELEARQAIYDDVRVTAVALEEGLPHLASKLRGGGAVDQSGQLPTMCAMGGRQQAGTIVRFSAVAPRSRQSASGQKRS
ncbi:hypothetical protein SH591_11625 [Sphingomonas sp. LY54]|uniref:hypothetical protein n=1 Tax=Sphingomonas sp. LY54 TaxID=3095343 RepID=UPI002D76517D|nr:hypothetical protein [Sphingomonas sp. LY54]WRP27752.1 hypothetical protein SH591_11625 [Sphingomonas sp. LY54]